MTVAADRATHGYALAQNEGEAFWLLGMLETVKLGKSDTNGTSGLVEIVVPPGVGSPWHVHSEEDEWFYVLEGQVTVYVAAKRFDLTSGGFAFGPKGVPHTFFCSGSTPARALVGFAPMQFEGFLREVGQPTADRVLPPPMDGAPPDIAMLGPIARRAGFIILGPPGPPAGSDLTPAVHPTTSGGC